MIYLVEMQESIKRIDSLNSRAFANININITLTDKLTEQAEKLSAEKNYTRGIAWSLLNRGFLELESGNYEQASGKLIQANHMFKNLKDGTRGLTASENSLGLLSIRQGNMKMAFTHLHKAMNASELLGFKDLQFTNMNYFGILQFKMENYNQALRFFNKALALNIDKKTASILNNLGCTYRALNKLDLSLEYLKKALKEAEIEEIKDSRIPILDELGLIYGELGHFKEGIKYLLQALDACTELHIRYKLMINIHLGELSLKMGDFTSAEKALILAKEYLTDSNCISNRRIYLLLSELSNQKGKNDKALKFYKKYHELSGKVKSTELDEKIWQMETKQLQKLNNRISTIGEMGKRLTARLEYSSVIETLLKSLNSLFNIDYCIIGKIDRENKLIHVKLYDKESESISEVRLNLENTENVILWVSRHKSGLLLNNLETEYKFYFNSLNDSIFPNSISSTICLPLETSDFEGVIGIFNHGRNSYNNEDREFLEMLTSFAAIAINNSMKTETINSYNRELEIINRYDSLTGIFNRRHFLKKMTSSWDLCCRKNYYFHFMLIDLDHFKVVNDTWGHEVGDICLSATSRIFKQLLQRSVDGFGRYGGEEFVVFLQGMTPEGAEEMAERIRSTIEKTPVQTEDKIIPVTASIGLISVKLNAKTSLSVQELIKKADDNMYQSKMNGRNQITSSILI